MNALAIIVAVFPAVIIVGAILAPVLIRRRSPRNHEGTLPEPGEAVQGELSPQQMPVQLVEAGLEVGSEDEAASGAGKRDQYLTDWTVLQDKFGG